MKSSTNRKGKPMAISLSSEVRSAGVVTDIELLHNLAKTIQAYPFTAGGALSAYLTEPQIMELIERCNQFGHPLERGAN